MSNRIQLQCKTPVWLQQLIDNIMKYQHKKPPQNAYKESTAHRV